MSWEEYEVIVINDGSTDNTLSLLELMGKRYPFLRYITTENSGVSASRNKGVEEACGEYLLFTDADDSILRDCLGGVYREMSANKLDMMLMGYQDVFSDGRCRKAGYHMDRNDQRIVSGREFLFRDQYPPMVYLYVFSHSFFVKHRFTFLSIRHEDEELIPKALFLARRIKYYPIVYYNYFQNERSFMNAYKANGFYDMISAMSSLDRFKSCYEGDHKFVKYIENLIASRILMIFKWSIREGYPIQTPLVEAIRTKGLYPLKYHGFSLYILLFNLSPVFFERLYRFLKCK